jgi:endo-1,4-beta-xylanase
VTLVWSTALAAALVLPLACGDAGSPTVDCASPGADCTLRQAAEQAGFRIGAAVRTGFQDDPEYVAALVVDFNSVTAEGVMKWDELQPVRGEFDFTEADRLIELAEANGMSVRGHALIWDQEFVDQMPDYGEQMTDADELRELMTTHIRTVVGHFRGRVDSWDVVNEPLQTLGDGLYENVFHRLLGPGYIAEALRLAHESDPDAILFVNDALVEFRGPKFDALLQLAADLRAQGAPLHAVGLQGHFLGQPRRDELQANLQALADLGVLVELTEVDITLRAGDGVAERLEQQRQDYFELASACLAVEACRRITLWGFTDRFTWIDGFFGPGLAPLVLDHDYQRKPAYFGLRDALVDAIGRRGAGG